MASQYDLDKKAQLEAQNAIKAKHGQALEETTEKSEPILPKTFKQKWDNYWYHYKALTIGLALASVFVIMFLQSMLFPTKYDASITLVTNNSFEGAWNMIDKGIQPILPDYDKNGDKLISINALQYNMSEDSDVNPQMFIANQTKLIAMLSSIENFLYIVDDDNYDGLVEMGVTFFDLTEIAGDNERVSGDTYDLTDTKLSRQLGLNELLDGMKLCLIDLHSYNEKKSQNKKINKIFENEKDLIGKMIEFG